MPPSISLESGECVYTVSSTAGSYECSQSGLRWSCAGPVTLQYRISKDELFWAQLQMLGYRPAGPLMEIKLLSGELEEVHLPHSLCLGGSDPVLLGDAVRALHGDDNGVSLETCELSRFHGRLSAQQFSLWQLVVWLGFPVRDHYEVQIYRHNPQPLILHIHLLPLHSSAKQELQKQYQDRGAPNIIKPHPNISVLMGSTLELHTSCPSKVTPPEVTLTCSTDNPSFEVCVEEPPERFNMELHSAEENRTVWDIVMRKGVDYHRRRPPQQPSRIPEDPLLAAASLEEKRPQLIQRVTAVMPIADQLLSQGFIGQETYANIHAAATSREKMRLLFDGLRSAGAQGKLAFYTILQEQLPHLVEELWSAR
ncbi:NACHT, LRR and PYD domains-containing protein 1 homolog [Engraulis encrasicolus]|uniref:NACHT, LRR and PYD domains-containing protein 1 homolog n=1 Tax=Engraulis encrasicolus TaxID=184585 RepID=UPI002FD4E339